MHTLRKSRPSPFRGKQCRSASTVTKPHIPTSLKGINSTQERARIRRAYLDRLKEELGGDLYNIRYRVHIAKKAGRSILLGYGDNLAYAVMTEYPEVGWKPWKFARTPSLYWDTLGKLLRENDPIAIAVAREYVTDFILPLVGKQTISDLLNYEHLPPLRVTDERRILKLGNSLAAIARQIIYNTPTDIPTEQNIKIQRFKDETLPMHWWKSNENCKTFLLHLAQQLGQSDQINLSNLYRATHDIVLRAGGASLISRYKSIVDAVMDIFPDHPWRPWKFERSPKGWWNKLAISVAKGDKAAINVLKGYVEEEIAPKYKVTRMEDWYKLVDQNLDVVTSTRVSHFGTLKSLLQIVYPEHPWEFSETATEKTELKVYKPAAGKILKRAYWNNENNRREYMDFIKSQLGGTYECLYEINYKHFAQTGGLHLLRIYERSPSLAVMHIYHEHHWHVWKFDRTPKGLYSGLKVRLQAGDVRAEATVREFIEDCAKLLHLNQVKDWYRVSYDDLASIGRSGAVLALGGLMPILQRVYPEISWVAARHASQMKKAVQRLVKKILQRLLPHYVILEEAPPEMLGIYIDGKLSTHSHIFRFDVAVPAVNLAIEYQGKQHYTDLFDAGGLNSQRERDDMRRKLCEEHGVTLIRVPYWWDKSEETLANSIHLVRPDLIPQLVGSGRTFGDEPPKRASTMLKLVEDDRILGFITPGMLNEVNTECCGYFLKHSLTDDDSSTSVCMVVSKFGMEAFTSHMANRRVTAKEWWNNHTFCASITGYGSPTLSEEEASTSAYASLAVVVGYPYKVENPTSEDIEDLLHYIDENCWLYSGSYLMMLYYDLCLTCVRKDRRTVYHWLITESTLNGGDPLQFD